MIGLASLCQYKCNERGNFLANLWNLNIDIKLNFFLKSVLFYSMVDTIDKSIISIRYFRGILQCYLDHRLLILFIHLFVFG